MRPEDIQLRFYIRQGDLERLRLAMEKRVQQLKKLEKTPESLAKIGQAYARSIAPKQTGILLKAIMWKTTKKHGAEIRVDKATLNTNPSNWNNFNYAAYMHYNDGVMGRGIKIHSGDPQFMYSTQDYLKNKLHEELKLSFGRH